MLNYKEAQSNLFLSVYT